MNFSCPTSTPDLAQIFNTTANPITPEFTLPYVILLSISLCIVIANAILTLANLYSLLFQMKSYNDDFKYAVFWNVSLFFAVSVAFLLMLIFMRAAVICQLLAEMMLAFGVYQFLNFLIISYGGKESMGSKLDGTLVGIFPCFCFCPNCPKTRRITRRKLNVYNILIAQMVIVVPGVDFLGIIIFTENSSYYDLHHPFSFKNAYFYLNLIRIISFILGNSSLTRVVQANWVYLKGTRLCTKLVLVIVVLNSVFMLRLFISLFTTLDVIKCHPPFTNIDVGNQIHAFLVIVIMFFAGIIARLVYISFPGERMEDICMSANQTLDVLQKTVMVQNADAEYTGERAFLTPYSPT